MRFRLNLSWQTSKITLSVSSGISPVSLIPTKIKQLLLLYYSISSKSSMSLSTLRFSKVFSSAKVSTFDSGDFTSYLSSQRCLPWFGSCYPYLTLNNRLVFLHSLSHRLLFFHYTKFYLTACDGLKVMKGQSEYSPEF